MNAVGAAVAGFAVVGLVGTGGVAVLFARVAAGQACRWIGKRLRRRPRAAAATPVHACDELLRLRDEHVQVELRRIGEDLRDDPDLHINVLDGLFADGPHTTDH